MLPKSCHIGRHRLASCLRLTLPVRVKLLIFSKQWMLFALTYLWELYLDKNVLMSAVKLMICPIMCAWSFPLCLNKVEGRILQLQPGYRYLETPIGITIEKKKKKNCLYMLLVSAFKSNVSHLGASSSSFMKKWKWQLVFLLQTGFIFHENQRRWCVTKA